MGCRRQPHVVVWPGHDVGREYWPPGLPRERTQTAFVAVFASLGYALCEGASPEVGYQKIPLFAPTHAAPQLATGRWSSELELGKAEDIEHGLHELEGALYGSVVVIQKRPMPPLAE